jgi:hypothetical protein
MIDDYCLLIVNHFRINNLFTCQQIRVHSFALQEFVNQFTVHRTVHLLAPIEFVNQIPVRVNNNMTVKFLSTVSLFSANFCLSQMLKMQAWFNVDADVVSVMAA